MTTPSQCQLSCRSTAVSKYCRGPPAAVSTPLTWARNWPALTEPTPCLPRTETQKGTGRAEGKIKGGGTSLARKAVCTGVGGDTAPGITRCRNWVRPAVVLARKRA
ncbi:hypothetical protein Psefu_2144 [Pseudomonas fulva 12-X]|uniref:Uncharacterized protein n=1 Tax=Pseudomonas fulva (strain 12-X) TaxID=743720 RepID=F6AAR2_PSEF1|nr:hypothetical protein Psefu_2144 [Pseudomonas fulva 12-X]